MTADKRAQADEVEALADIFRRADDEALVRTNFGQLVAEYDEAARAVLASDWFARRLAEARAEALREAADDVFGASYISAGAPIFRADFADWLRERADRPAAEQIGGEQR